MLRTLQRQNARSFSSTSAVLKKASTPKPRVLAKPDRFRPPSHPQRIVPPSPKGVPAGQPFEYGPRTTEKERIEQSKTQYPGMFPPEGTVMHRFLTSKWIHVWIAMVSILIPQQVARSVELTGPGRSHLLCGLYIHNELQSNVSVRASPPSLVGSVDFPVRHDLAGILCVADACAA
jgi:hypothetical protein